MSKDHTIPTTKIARSKVVGKAILKIGSVHAKERMKRAFLSLEQKKISKEETHEKTAKVVMESLGELKGVSIKIAQQVALGMPFLPQAYLDEMSKSFQAVPPINRALVRKVIKQELFKYPEKIFESFDSVPFGAASLGQVHYALYKREKIALKIQYPGIATSIQSDLSLLKFALSRFAKGKNIDHIILEIRERLLEEVDYLQEAENLDFFYHNLKHKDVVIPRLYEPLTTIHLLASSYIDGKSLDEFLASNPTQAEKNHYAQILFDIFFITLYQLKRVHADPNPGNFIFLEDGKLALIDFGCVKCVDDEFLESYNTLHLSLIDGLSDTLITEQYLALDMIDEADSEVMLSFYREVIKPLDRIYIEIFLEDSYCFKENNDFSRRGFETILEVQQKQTHSVHKMNQEYIFLDRTLLGYYALFEKMGAEIDTKFAKGLMRGFM